MWRAVVVLALVPSILAAGRGDSCVNQHGRKATCTSFAFCKAAMDAVAIANGSKILAAGIVCGYDTEPLVCCQTSEDAANSPSVESGTNILSTGFSSNGVLEMTLNLPEVGDRADTSGVNEVPEKGTSTSQPVENAIYTSPPIESKQPTPEAPKPTTFQQPTEASAADALPLASNDTTNNPNYPDIFTQSPDQSLDINPNPPSTESSNPSLPPDSPFFKPGADSATTNLPLDLFTQPDGSIVLSIPKIPKRPSMPNNGDASNAPSPGFSSGLPPDTNQESNPPDPPFPGFSSAFPPNTNEGSNPPNPQFPGFSSGFPPNTNEGSNPPNSQFPEFSGGSPPNTNEGPNPLNPQSPGFSGGFPPNTNEGSNPPNPQFPGSSGGFPPNTNEGSNPPSPQFPGSAGGIPPNSNEGPNPQFPQFPGMNEGATSPPFPGSFPGGFPSNFPQPSFPGFGGSDSFPDPNASGQPSPGFPPLFVPNKPSAPFPEPPKTTTESPNFDPSLHVHKLLPDQKTCGLQHERKRMAHWPISTIDEFPWVALLNYGNGRDFEAGFRCAGTLISKNYVVSAAQCVQDNYLYQLKSVRLGDWSLHTLHDCVYDSKGEECTNDVLDVRVVHKIPHPYYDPLTGANNVGLARLERNVEFSDFIRPICLPVENLQPPTPDVILTTSGWGACRSGVQLDIKSKYFLSALPSEMCSKVSYKQAPQDNQCVGALARMSFCFVDSGGPIMVENSEHQPQWYLEGVAADGFSCGTYGLPGTYTRVTHHVQWILQTLSNAVYS